jgi:hypothetical protein
MKGLGVVMAMIQASGTALAVKATFASPVGRKRWLTRNVISDFPSGLPPV